MDIHININSLKHLQIQYFSYLNCDEVFIVRMDVLSI